jgi:hypothetical protein
MLLDRVCPGGGWNAGNGVVYGVPGAPHPDDTAIAPLALREHRRDPMVQSSVQYLERIAPSLTAPWSLAWATLALAAYGRPIDSIHSLLVEMPDLSGVDDLCATVQVHFVIADGIVAMEGNGPLNGTPRPLGKIVIADDPVAADATCARLMGFEPDRTVHIREGSRSLGNASAALIDQVGENKNGSAAPFQVVSEFRFLYKRTTGMP